MVLGLAWKVGCIDCGHLWDHYMVSAGVWRRAGLRRADYCCRECLALRLKRALRPHDFTRCLVNCELGPLELTTAIKAKESRGLSALDPENPVRIVLN